jgi:hypothetical protein
MNFFTFQICNRVNFCAIQRWLVSQLGTIPRLGLRRTWGPQHSLAGLHAYETSIRDTQGLMTDNFYYANQCCSFFSFFTIVSQIYFATCKELLYTAHVPLYSKY